MSANYSSQLVRIADALEQIADALKTAPKQELTEVVKDALSRHRTEQGRAFQ